MLSKITAARPYAKAIFKIAKNNNCLDEWSYILLLLKTIVLDKSIQNIISNQTIAKLNKAKIIIDLFYVFVEKKEIINISELNFELNIEKIVDNINNFKQDIEQFINLLSENNKLNFVFEIFELFEKLKFKNKNITKVQIELGDYKLEKDDLYSKLYVKLKKEIGTELKIEEKEQQNNLISGFIAKINDDVMDFSLSGKLQELGKVLKG